MNSLARVFSNFRDFYSEINAATLTGAIDVIVVEQKDGEFQCSPFHVRFGKMGVLRSREKVVDIEINGAPVDIQMKLGDAGEAFFVEECLEDDDDELPANLATSPIPLSFMNLREHGNDTMEDISGVTADKNASEELQIPLPLPRRNSIDFSKEEPKEAAADGNHFENQASDYTKRRHTDNTLERRNLSEKLKEFTTQKIRQEWAEHEELFQEKSEKKPAEAELEKDRQPEAGEEVEKEKEKEKEQPKADITVSSVAASEVAKDVSKSKTKKRRKKTQMKKNAQRKNSSSSSVGSAAGGDVTTTKEGVATVDNIDEGDATAPATAVAIIAANNSANSSSNDELPSASLLTAHTGIDSAKGDEPKAIANPTAKQRLDLDMYFFSDTEITGPSGGATNRPPSPFQSDSELETTIRARDQRQFDQTAANWNWGELPDQAKTESINEADAQQVDRQSMLSNVFSFMKKANRLRKEVGNEAGDIYLSDLNESMDPEMAALYFPSSKLKEGSTATILEEDRESGNGTSLPHSPSSLEEGQKSMDSDFDENKQQRDKKYLDFVAMSMTGMPEHGGPPSEEDFDRHLVSYPDVCANPSLFSSPNLVVRLNGKYYPWTAACPIVMTMIAFQKPLTEDAIEQLMTQTDEGGKPEMPEMPEAAQAGPAGQTKRYWWSWRRPQDVAPNRVSHDLAPSKDEKDGDNAAAVATQTSRPLSPTDNSEPTPSKSDSLAENAENTSALVDNLEELTSATNKSDEPKERYKKSLRLSSAAIKKLNLKEGTNEIEFSVTTAYQGTSRCKCYLYRWKHNDKVVISDIDGTITRSDVLGHILPMVGKDWAQLGVAQLFSKIEQNGYKLLYLSARAIGQSRLTREYLRSIRQGNVKLPDGPLLLNPTSLISAFHREVIEKKPEQFKIACLSDIRDLFPEKEPFYAGYGNRINDVWAYRAVGIPIMRIFTINTKGELKHELTQTFQSSYCSMTYIVDQLFPPVKLDEAATEFSNFNYWRDPIPDLVIPELETALVPPSPNVDKATLRPIPEK
ncbi:phosphatidate phosphatase LPIN3 isoform X2 [Drosophila pseudoobscura]|uniref:phosphatidate phosphatase n=2 Tax=pseudoobscura subgroup TaxID=32358 RepID=A0A6I8VU95_DROPS|nr:phosphatidate phosphatase LPIN3 isoform X2 [Drosophila pseudoobscura]